MVLVRTDHGLEHGQILATAPGVDSLYVLMQGSNWQQLGHNAIVCIIGGSDSTGGPVLEDCPTLDFAPYYAFLNDPALDLPTSAAGRTDLLCQTFGLSDADASRILAAKFRFPLACSAICDIAGCCRD
jgi:hypothetical protein